jgi:hypothetical protein
MLLQCNKRRPPGVCAFAGGLLCLLFGSAERPVPRSASSLGKTNMPESLWFFPHIKKDSGTLRRLEGYVAEDHLTIPRRSQ